MAIGWLSVLQLVPWGDVISNTPKIVDGAKKLLRTVAKKPPDADLPAAGGQPQLSPQAQAIAVLESQLALAQLALEALHGQMLQSSELIKALADQNTQLVKCAEIQRSRTRWLFVATGVLALAFAGGLAMAFFKLPL